MKLAVIDSETDPEDYDGEYLPFVIGFSDGASFRYFWDDEQPGSCVLKFVNWLSKQESMLIYAHNGGKFDYMFMLDHFSGAIMIQNSRIIKAKIGRHEFRDSYSIIPVALTKFKGEHRKKQFSTPKEQTQFYKSKFNRKNRLKNKNEIVDYLRLDCLALYDGVKAFRDEFGDKLTIGSTAMKELKKLHKFETLEKVWDEEFRNYYFGGRNQCFRQGVMRGDFKIYDVNSMYPFVMKTVEHPISRGFDEGRSIKNNTTFAEIEADNWGALPTRTETGLDFTIESGTFKATIHEINAGLDTGTLRIRRVVKSYAHHHTTTFEKFVDYFYDKRMKAKQLNDEMLVLFYKLILNSAYGKFGQNPENFQDYIITHDELPHITEGWTLNQTNGKYMIWSKPSERRSYFNVCTAASITGAARAVLLRGLAMATKVVYCDTDSIICESLDGNLDDNMLGAWKEEGAGQNLAIAGKKLYSLLAGCKKVKSASKGAIIEPEQIFELARGGQITITNPVPHFNFAGQHGFVTRTLKATGAAKPFRAPIR